MILRQMNKTDAQKAHDIFFDAVHAVDERYYSEAQKSAWAPTEFDNEQFSRRVSDGYALVAVDTDKNGKENMIGYGNIDDTGYIDHLYVAKEAQGKGVGKAICDSLEKFAKGKNIKNLTVHASKNAKSFFEARGFKVIAPREVVRKGIKLTNFLMEKQILTV